MIPDFQTLMQPVLALLADGTVRRSREVKDAMADEFGLTDSERAELLPSGRQRTIDNRVGWSLTYLSQAGLVALIKPQFEAGRAALKKGIVRDEAVQAAVCGDIVALLDEMGCAVQGPIPSPIEGGDGNREFLVAARRSRGLQAEP